MSLFPMTSPETADSLPQLLIYQLITMVTTTVSAIVYTIYVWPAQQLEQYNG